MRWRSSICGQKSSPPALVLTELCRSQWFHFTLWLFNTVMENDPFIDNSWWFNDLIYNLPIFLMLMFHSKLLNYNRVPHPVFAASNSAPILSSVEMNYWIVCKEDVMWRWFETDISWAISSSIVQFLGEMSASLNPEILRQHWASTGRINPLLKRGCPTCKWVKQAWFLTHGC